MAASEFEGLAVTSLRFNHGIRRANRVTSHQVQERFVLSVQPTNDLILAEKAGNGWGFLFACKSGILLRRRGFLPWMQGSFAARWKPHGWKG